EPAGEVQCPDLVRMHTAQQPQGVVLLRRQVILAEDLFFQGAQAVIGAPQTEEDFLLQRIEAARLLRVARQQYCHDNHISRTDNSCLDNLIVSGRALTFSEPLPSESGGMGRSLTVAALTYDYVMVRSAPGRQPRRRWMRARAFRRPNSSRGQTL